MVSTKLSSHWRTETILEHQLSIYFLKNRVTLKTVEMKALTSGINYILKYIKIENSYFKL